MKILHTMLRVGDMPKSVKFYTEGLGMKVLRTKSIEQSLADTDEPEYQLKRRLNAIDLTVFGIGVIIGAGIFTLTGRVANQYAGPGVVFSFVLAACCLASLAARADDSLLDNGNFERIADRYQGASAECSRMVVPQRLQHDQNERGSVQQQ